LITPFGIICKRHGEIVDATAIITTHNFTTGMGKLFAGIGMKPVMEIKTTTNLLAEYQ
jgi:hypothetical protein